MDSPIDALDRLVNALSLLALLWIALELSSIGSMIRKWLGEVDEEEGQEQEADRGFHP